MEWLYTELWNYFKAYLEKGFKNIFSKFRLKKRLKMTCCQIIDSILSDFQNEIYYNDLDKYLYNNKVLSNYIALCVSTDITDNHNIISFISEKVDIFLSQYPQYVAQKSRIHSTISKIFMVAFNSLNQIEDENIRSAVTILKQHAISIEKTLSSMETKLDSLGRKSDENTSKVLECIDKIVSKEGKSSFEMVYSIIAASFVVPDIDINKICKRESVTVEINGILSSYDWLHLMGSVWSGKTITAILLKYTLQNSFWIDFSLNDPISTIKAFRTVCESKSINLTNYVVIIDNLPEIQISSAFRYELTSFIEFLINKGCRIVSFSKDSIPESFKASTKVNSIEKQLPEFSKEDVIELLSLYNAPKNFVQDKSSEFLLCLTGKKPIAIIIIIQYLKSLNWNIHTDAFSKILSLDIDELSAQLNKIIPETIPNDSTRDLLYRISSVGYPVTRTQIEKIANIEPKINLVGEKLTELKKYWVTGDEKLSANSVLKKLSLENLGDELKKNINNVMADLTIEKHVLDQMDVFHLICHLIAAERYNDAGYAYIRAMQAMCEENMEYNDTLIFSKIWCDMPLPDAMDNSVKAAIRMYQIWYATLTDKNCNYAIDDLIKISEIEHLVRELVMCIATILLNSNMDVAMKLIKAIDKQGMPTEYTMYQEIDINPLSAISSMWFFKMKGINDVVEWYEFAKKNISDSIIREIEKSTFSDFFSVGLERVRQLILDDEIIDFVSKIKEIREFAIEKNWKNLIIGCSCTLIRIEGLNKKDYTSSKSLYETYISELDDDEYKANLRYCIGLVALDNNDNDFARRCLCKSIEKGLETVNKVNCCVFCYVVFMKENMQQEAKSAIDQAIKIIENSKDIIDSLRKEFLVKAHFERVICYYLCGDFSNALNSLEYINCYLNNEPIEGNEHIIAIISHCITYIYADVTAKNPPKKLNVTEKYEPPYPGVMWNKDASKDFINFANEYRVIMVHISSAQLFDMFSYNKDKAKELSLWGYEKICINDSDDKIYNFLGLYGYLIFKLFDLKEQEKAANLLGKLLNNFAKLDAANTFVRLWLIKLATYITINSEDLEKIYSSLSKLDISQNLKNIWVLLLEKIEMYITNKNADFWIQQGNSYSKNNDKFMQEVCYIFAVVNGNIQQQLNIHLQVFSSAEGVFKDTYWMNDIYKKYVRVTIFESLNNYGLLSEDMLDSISKHFYDSKQIKEMYKKIISVLRGFEIPPNSLEWLDE